MQGIKYGLRKISEDDYGFVYQVKKEAYKGYVEEYYGAWDEERQREYFKAFIESFGDGAYIITADGQDIGFFNASRRGEEYEIGNICIIPQYRNMGIGTAILKDVLYRNAGKEISLQHFRSNPAGRLYKRLGFELAEETETHCKLKYKNDKTDLS